mgnify:CR=1 FL=1
MNDNIKAVILDFDGTIGDTRGLIVRTMQQTLAEVGLPQRSDDECAAMIGLPLKQTFTCLMPMDDATGDLCETTYRRIFFENNRPGAVSPFPGVCDVIRRMHRAGLLVTIASSRFRASLMAFLEEMELVPYVPYVLGAGDVDHAKPAPDMVLKTLADNGLRPEEAIVVGDTVFDIRMAHAAGVKAVGVTYGNGRRGDLERERAEWIIDGFRELDGIVGIGDK